MNNLKKRIGVGMYFLRYAHKCLSILKCGQSEEFEIMMLAHRLEKGLVNSKPKPQWGEQKAERLGFLLNRNKQAFSYQTGLAVLHQYLENKRKNPVEQSWVENFIKKYKFDTPIVNGGIIRLPKEEISNLNVAEIEKFFLTRHSTRAFADTQIDEDALEKAITLAMRCPSACNRQPYRIYYMDAQQRFESTGSQDKSTASLYITGIISAFEMSEVLDWIVSPSIFTAYLTLTLHAFGIGSCIYRKDLVCSSEYNDKVKQACGIPDNEQLILELRIGNYAEETIVAYSNRLNVKQIIKYI